MTGVYFIAFFNLGCKETRRVASSFHCPKNSCYIKHIDGVMVGGLTSSVVGHGLQHRFTKAYL